MVGDLPDFFRVALDTLDYRVRIELVQEHLTVLSPKYYIPISRQNANRKHICLVQTLLKLNLNVALLGILK